MPPVDWYPSSHVKEVLVEITCDGVDELAFARVSAVAVGQYVGIAIDNKQTYGT